MKKLRCLGTTALFAALLLDCPGRAQDQTTAASAAAPAAAPATAQESAAASVPASASSPAAAAPQPLPNPAMSGPLQTAFPHEFAAGPFGKLAVTGVFSGMGLVQGKSVTGDNQNRWDLSNGQVFIQKTSGWWQFYLQAGAYNIPDLGLPFLSTSDTVKNLYGPFPQGYLKLVKGNFSFMAGALPTLIGAEYTFDFQNMNIARGLLWNQENAVNRGIQLNETYKKLTFALSWNDGFYSNRYNWLSGSLTYAPSATHSFSFVGMGNAGSYAKNTLATPVLLNNSQIYNFIYTYTHEAWVVQPYFQYTDVPTNAKIGITQGASTRAGALLLTYNFKNGISIPVRPEYIASSGGVSSNAANLLYGPGSKAFAFTVTPTYRKEGFFLRGEFSIVKAIDFTKGSAFGKAGLDATQPRGLIEAGFMF